MVMSSQAFADLVEGPSKTIFDGRYASLPTEWNKVFEQQEGKKARFQDTTVLYGLGTAVEKAEGTALTQDAGGIAYRMRGVFKVYGLMAGITEEMRDDAEGIQVATHWAKELADAVVETKEVVHADIFNRAANGSYVHGDGVSLLSASHPYAIGGTYSNRLPAAADLSEASLEALATMVALAKNDRAKPMSLKIEKLVIAPKNWFNALRILRSTLQSGSANNDINVLRSQNVIPGEPFKLTRLTQENAYFVLTNSPHGLMHYHRGGVRRGMQVDFVTGNCWWKVTDRYLAMVEGARCVFGDMGI